MTSRTDSGAGNITINIATDFSSADWASLMFFGHTANVAASAAAARAMGSGSKAAGTVNAVCMRGDTGAAADPTTDWNFVGFGDQ